MAELTIGAMIAGAVVLLVCVASSKFLYRFGVPALLIFLVLGMLCGSDGIIGIQFDSFETAKQICSVGLIFIMFYGGFGTSWKAAKPVALPSILMSTLGVIITAGLTGVFCHYVLGTTWLEGLLIGSVIGSTDAASVFSILRSRKLNLKGGLASLLEIESGSNDPIAYMLTIVVLALMSPLGTDPWSIVTMLLAQVGFGLFIGFVLAKLSVFILRRFEFEIVGLYPIFVTAIAVLSYARLYLWYYPWQQQNSAQTQPGAFFRWYFLADADHAVLHPWSARISVPSAVGCGVRHCSVAVPDFCSAACCNLQHFKLVQNPF